MSGQTGTWYTESAASRSLCIELCIEENREYRRGCAPATVRRNFDYLISERILCVCVSCFRL